MNGFENQLEKILALAEQYLGATSPNPCVGAAAVSKEGTLLSIMAHQKAGTPHAEALVITDLRERGLLSEAHTLLVTLEPCNHHGRTPPCSEGIILAHQETGAFKKVIFICRDPNPKVPGHGLKRLQEAGIETRCLEDDEPEGKIVARGLDLIRAFAYWTKTGKPWVTIKIARNLEKIMIPPSGAKTFTSESSLTLAHELRKRADAIMTGSGTILADRPLLTVRNVADHAEKKRRLVIMDRRGRVDAKYIEQAQANGFEVLVEKDVSKALDLLGSQGCLEVLVEAGPTLTDYLIQADLWNEQVVITTQTPPLPDRIEVLRQKRYGAPR
jgi:diaminohydroxyphosphoribosylaminopyrimidine deaminase/5-amino-6-(5-phosphoribosylamino)uracil reductase